MSTEETPRKRRSAASEPVPEMPSGWRTSRRGSKAAKKARKDIKRHGRKETASTIARKTKRTARDIVYLGALTIGGILAAFLAIYLVVLGVNGLARWNAVRSVEEANSVEAQAERAEENLLLIAVDDDKATGFLAVRDDAEAGLIYGIAIPDAAFIEVPGQGFERIGDSFHAGADVSLAAVSNFFTVPFTTYAVIDTEIYQSALTSQSLAGVTVSFKDTNLSDEQVEAWATTFDETPAEKVAIVPLPVKPISLGSETYFEPQRDEVADLLDSWWGITIGDSNEVPRVIVYNGSGVPGIAGEAAQELIRGGFRVVDTKNADTFDYDTTKVVIQNGDTTLGDDITKLLRVGEVTEQSADQRVADVIIIIGKDYEPAEITE